MTPHQQRCQKLASAVMDLIRPIASGDLFVRIPLAQQGKMIRATVDEAERLLRDLRNTSQDLEK